MTNPPPVLPDAPAVPGTSSRMANAARHHLTSRLSVMRESHMVSAPCKLRAKRTEFLHADLRIRHAAHRGLPWDREGPGRGPGPAGGPARHHGQVRGNAEGGGGF